VVSQRQSPHLQVKWSANGAETQGEQGPLRITQRCREAMEAASERWQELGKQAERMQREVEAATPAASKAQEGVARQRERVAELERTLREQRRILGDMEKAASQAEQRRREVEAQAKRTVEAAQAAEKEVARLRAELERVSQRAAEFVRVLGGRSVRGLSMRDVSDVLRELELGKHVQVFESNMVDGAVLGALSNEQLKELGMSAASERGRLRHAMSMIEACGQLRLTAAEMKQMEERARSKGEKEAVVIATWDAGRVGVWLEENKVPKEVWEKVVAANVSGKQLLHMTDDDMKQLGIAVMGVRVRMNQLIETVRKSHFAALRAFFGGDPQSPSPSASSTATTSGSVGLQSSSGSSRFGIGGTESLIFKGALMRPGGYEGTTRDVC